MITNVENFDFIFIARSSINQQFIMTVLAFGTLSQGGIMIPYEKHAY